MVSKGSTLYHRCSVDCRPGGRRSNTKRWWCLVALVKALDLLGESPGPPSLGNACSIPPSHRHCYQNGQRQRYILLLSAPLSFDQNVAKRPCYCPFTLILSYYLNLIGVISLFVSYWPPPTTRDTISATIVAGGRARIQLN